MPSRRLASLALDAEARIEKRIVGRRQCLGALPRHRPVAVCLARGRGDDKRSIPELPAMKGAHVLYDKLKMLGLCQSKLSRHVLDIKADNTEPLCDEALGPAVKTCIQIYC
jgi:hypothetical protein